MHEPRTMLRAQLVSTYLVGACIVGCGSLAAPSAPKPPVDSSICFQPHQGLRRAFRAEARSEAERLADRAVLTEHLPEDLSSLAEHIDVAEPLAYALRHMKSSAALDVQAATAMVLGRIQLATMHVAELEAALDCEEERLGHAAAGLSRYNRRVEQRLTVAAITTGAAAGALVASLEAIALFGGDRPAGLPASAYAGTALGIALAAAVAEGALGVAVLTHDRALRVTHVDNPLRDILLDDLPSGILPALLVEHFDEILVDGQTRREQMRQVWETRISGDEGLLQRLLAKEGHYTLDELETRIDMTEQLEAEAGLIVRNLRRLLDHSLRALQQPLLPPGVNQDPPETRHYAP